MFVAVASSAPLQLQSITTRANGWMIWLDWKLSYSTTTYYSTSVKKGETSDYSVLKGLRVRVGDSPINRFYCTGWPHNARKSPSKWMLWLLYKRSFADGERARRGVPNRWSEDSDSKKGKKNVPGGAFLITDRPIPLPIFVIRPLHHLPMPV